MSATEPLIDAPPGIPELHFGGGLPGFPSCERFGLVQWGDDPSSPFALLQCVEHPDLSFVVVPPNLFFPDYAPVITDSAAEALELTSADDALLLAIVTVGDPIETSTLNLLGPIVINTKELIGSQVILDPERFSSSEPIAVGT